MISRNDDACLVPLVLTKQISILGLGHSQDGENFALLQIHGRHGLRWLGSFEQRFRLAKWSVCRG
jgi:hypothetical protein